MFGFGQSYDDEYLELYEHLTQKWGMKPVYAKSFLSAYKKSIGKMFVKGKKRLEKLGNFSDTEMKITGALNPGYECDLVLVEQAYVAYFWGLRRGKHVGTTVEKAIWAILYTKQELVFSFDKNFSNYIQKNQEKEFPGLFEEVFLFSSKAQPLEVTDHKHDVTNHGGQPVVDGHGEPQTVVPRDRLQSNYHSLNKENKIYNGGTGYKKCKICAEDIKKEAIKCRFCGEYVVAEQSDNDKARPEMSTINYDHSFDERMLCRDETCVGTVGNDGKCRYCGLSNE